MRQSSFGLQPRSMYSASCSKRSIGPPPDWGMDMGDLDLCRVSKG